MFIILILSVWPRLSENFLSSVNHFSPWCFDSREKDPLVRLSNAQPALYFRYYKKVAVKQKQRQNSDEESIEDVDDDEFERMIGECLCRFC